MFVRKFSRELRWQSKQLTIFSISFGITVLTGCSTIGVLPKNNAPLSTINGPRSKPIKTLTSFTESLECIDNILASRSYPEILVAVELSEEGAGSVVGMRDMVMTSLSNMSMKSNVIKVVVKSPPEDAYYEYTDAQQFKPPDYFILLSSPQFENRYRTNTADLDFRAPLLPTDLGASREANASLISLDMNMGSHRTLQLLPGVNARNSIALVNGSKKYNLSLGISENSDGLDSGYGSDYDSYSDDLSFEEGGEEFASEEEDYGGSDFQPSVGQFTKFGTNFQLNYGYREGVHAAVRTLIELGTIELIGKYAKIGYRDCLRDPKNLLNAVNNAETEAPTTVSITASPPRNVSYQRGDLVEVQVSSKKGINAYCYYQDQNNLIYQILPNPYQSENSIGPGQNRKLPGDSRLKIVVDNANGIEQIQCAAHDIPVKDNLPAELTSLSFYAIPYKSMDEVISIHETANPQYLLSNVYKISEH